MKVEADICDYILAKSGCTIKGCVDDCIKQYNGQGYCVDNGIGGMGCLCRTSC